MARFCRIFYCDERGDRFCCADCHLARDCANPCRNHPTRCGQEDLNGAPAKRRGGTGKLTPKYEKND